MEFIAIPFTAKISRDDSSITVAKQVQSIIDTHTAQGLEYLRMERVETRVQATKGCFGFGGEPGYTTSYQILIFKK